MPRFVALLRAVNVGGTGKLPMADLRADCSALGYENVRTYLASGNVVFDAAGHKDEVRTALEATLSRRVGKPATVILTDRDRLARLRGALPFAEADGARVGILFLNRPALPSDLGSVRHRIAEDVRLAEDHIVIHFPDGMGRSRLKLDAFDQGTLRNRNTVEALARMADD